MADPKVRFKRSSVPGKIPNETQLPLGEIALNTYDGKVFASKNVGIGTTVFTVNPWNVGTGTDVYDINFTAGNVGVGSTLPTSKLDVTGNVKVSGIATATSFSGSGSNLTGIVTSIAAGSGISIDQATGKVTITSTAGAGAGVSALSSADNYVITLTPSFNGITTAFTMQYNGNNYSPLNAQQLLVSLGGVIQEPTSAYTVSSSTITFASAPNTQTSYFITALNTAPLSRNAQSYNVTGVQTNFTLTNGYTIGYVDVYLNGARLVSGDDYTATNGTTVGLTSAAQNGDVVEVVGYKAVSLSTDDLVINGNLKVVGITTLGNYVQVGVGSTALIVNGDARVTGILTVGSSSVTIDGINNRINVGTGLTISNGIVATGVITATSFVGDGSGLTGAGSTVVDDTSTNQTLYPVLTAQTSGTITASKVSTTKLSFNPSTGVVSATTFNGNITGTAATFTGNVSIAGTLTYEDVTNVDSIGIVTARSGIQVTGGNLLVGSTSATGTSSQPLQVTGGAYVSGNIGIGTTNPSSNLHISGSAGTLLRIDGGSGGTGTRDIVITEFNTSAYGGIIRYDSGADLFTFGTIENSTVVNAINVTRAAGNVGVGLTNPTSKLHVSGDVNITGVTTASRFISTVATGTAPLTVSSTTLVSNLNADLLDGFDSGSIVLTRSTTVSTNSTDFNTITTPGTYTVSGNGTWTGSSNGPTSAYAYGQLVVTTNGNVVTQNYYTHNTTGHWVRSKFNASDWQSWQEYWTNLNDGSGSGLDADTLDGYNVGTSGGTIPLLNGSNTWSNTNTFSGTDNGIVVSSTNNTDDVWAGGLEIREVSFVANTNTTSAYAPAITFHWASVAASAIKMYADASIRMTAQGSAGSSYRDTYVASLVATGNVTAYSSDQRLKENIKNIENSLEKVLQLNGCTFDWNEKSKELGFTPKHETNDIGLLAQEVEKVLPQAVAPAPFDQEWDGEKNASKSGENYLTIQYERLVPLLVEAIKEQQEQINTLKEEINNLKK